MARAVGANTIEALSRKAGAAATVCMAKVGASTMEAMASETGRRAWQEQLGLHDREGGAAATACMARAGRANMLEDRTREALVWQLALQQPALLSGCPAYCRV